VLIAEVEDWVEDWIARELGLIKRDCDGGDGAPGELERGDLAPGELERGDRAPGELERGDGAPGELERGDRAPGELERGDGAPGELERDDRAPGELERGDLAPGELERGDGAPGELERGDRAPGELGRDGSGKWRTWDVPDDFHDVLIAEVELSSGSREYYLCSINDEGEMVDSESGDSLGWQYDCITKWVPFDEVLTWLKG